MSAEIKKDWNRAKPLDLYHKEPGFHYRWVRRDNVQRKKFEGYVVVKVKKSKLQGKKVNKSGSIHKYRELVLMRLPIKMKKVRDRHFQQRADRQMESVTQLNRSQSKMGLTTLRKLGHDKGMHDPVMEESVR